MQVRMIGCRTEREREREVERDQFVSHRLKTLKAVQTDRVNDHTHTAQLSTSAGVSL